MANPVEFEQLAQYLFPLAMETLEETEGLYPCAAFVNSEGKIEAFSVYLGEDRDLREAFDAHIVAFQQDAPTKRYRAIGVCADGRGPHPDGSHGDALLLTLEHESGVAMTICMPYLRGPNGFCFADTSAYARTRQVFV